MSATAIQEVDTLIIGAGLVGSSVAMHLAQRGVPTRVIDFDLEGTFSSSELNAGGVRATFGQEINVLVSMASIDYYRSVAEDVGYRACGYRWLHTKESWARAQRAQELQIRLGWQVEAWDRAAIQRNVPFLDKLDDVVGAMFAPRDGLLNPNLLKHHYRERARTKGVVFDDRTLLVECDSSAIATGGGLLLKCERFVPPVTEDKKREVLEAEGLFTERKFPVRYRARRVINCAGPWAPKIAQILGYACPSHPVRRQVAIFDCRDVNLTPYGMFVDTSGVYFHPEATNGLAGFANLSEPAGFNYHYDGEQFFSEQIWPALYERSSSFERLRHLTGWAGLYEVSPDESAIIGAARVGASPLKDRVFEAHSFSGHGAMHSYAAGRGLAEWMTSGTWETIDLSPLSSKRFELGHLLKEQLVI